MHAQKQYQQFTRTSTEEKKTVTKLGSIFEQLQERLAEIDAGSQDKINQIRMQAELLVNERDELFARINSLNNRISTTYAMIDQGITPEDPELAVEREQIQAMLDAMAAVRGETKADIAVTPQAPQPATPTQEQIDLHRADIIASRERYEKKQAEEKAAEEAKEAKAQELVAKEEALKEREYKKETLPPTPQSEGQHIGGKAKKAGTSTNSVPILTPEQETLRAQLEQQGKAWHAEQRKKGATVQKLGRPPIAPPEVYRDTIINVFKDQDFTLGDLFDPQQGNLPFSRGTLTRELNKLIEKGMIERLPKTNARNESKFRYVKPDQPKHAPVKSDGGGSAAEAMGTGLSSGPVSGTGKHNANNWQPTDSDVKKLVQDIRREKGKATMSPGGHITVEGPKGVIQIAGTPGSRRTVLNDRARVRRLGLKV